MKMCRGLVLIAVLLLDGPTRQVNAQAPVVTVGCKDFTESVVLAHVVGRVIADAGGKPKVTKSLGGTMVVWKALTKEKPEIDVYVEYTGTLAQQILKDKNLKGSSPRAIREVLPEDLRLSDRLGFNNSYALGMQEDEAARLGIQSISDLLKHKLTFAVSSEFNGRRDGWSGLSNHYKLGTAVVTTGEHAATMRAVDIGDAHVTDVYTTDAEIKKYKLRVLVDDRRYFPRYDAVLVYRKGLPPQIEAALLDLEGKIDDVSMIEMNERATIDLIPPARVADEFVNMKLKQEPPPAAETTWEWAVRMLTGFLERTWQHLLLVIVSLTLAIVVALPLGVLAYKRPGFGEAILAGTGVVQTIPSLAILVLMIPLFGLGVGPAVAALFLYSLLPIVRNTCTGLRDIPGQVRESALALGLPAMARLRLVELPISAPSILAGIKTAAVINVGTATIGALINAGGYGEPIITGLRLNNLSLILQGAIPAAVLALAVQWLFELAERRLVSKGLRLRPGT